MQLYTLQYIDFVERLKPNTSERAKHVKKLMDAGIDMSKPQSPPYLRAIGVPVPGGAPAAAHH
jgi:hypothetical protein